MLSRMKRLTCGADGCINAQTTFRRQQEGFCDINGILSRGNVAVDIAAYALWVVFNDRFQRVTTIAGRVFVGIEVIQARYKLIQTGHILGA